MLALYFFLIISNGMVLSISIGRVYNARLVTTDNSTWLYSQINADSCLCNAMYLFNSKLVALNYYSSNKSCELFISTITSLQIISYKNSTLILLQSLPIPCCSNLAWLLQQIQQAQRPSSVAVSDPTFLSINSVNNLLSVQSYFGSRTLFNRTNLNIIINTTSVGTDASIASQSDSLYISSCDSPYSVRIYNETKSGLQLRYTVNVTRNPRQAIFILNNTWLLVLIQYLRVIQFYSVDLITNKFQYNQSVSIPYDVVWSLTERNDSFIYICFWSYGVPVHTLFYNGISWIVSNLTATKPSSSEIMTQVAIDSCERMWVAVYGFGIRIYDKTGQTLLANWSSIATGLDTLLILDTYETFFGDYDNNKILYFAPNLQCTS